MYMLNMRWFSTNRDSFNQGIFFFEKKNITVTKVTKIAAIEATSFTANCSMQTVDNQFGHMWKEW